MYKIIKIDGETVFVGKTGGEFTEIPLSNFGFEPKVGDFIEFYQNGEEYIVSKVNPISGFTGTVPTGQSSAKSRVTAGVLAILLGAFGGYDFYIGKTGMGVVRLVISLLTIIPFIAPLIMGVNLIWNLIVGISVLTSKPGSKWHKDAQGLELLD